jgi:hypothetical protein
VAQRKNTKDNKLYLGILGILFLFATLVVVLGQVDKRQYIAEKAVGGCNITANQCPGSDGVLRNCLNPGPNGIYSESICNPTWRGRIEPCGSSIFCCNGSAWSTNMSACATPIPTRSPTPLPTARPTASPTLSPRPTPVITPCPSTAADPTAWDVNQDGTVNILDIGRVIDNYAKPPSLIPRTDVNHDCFVDIIDIGIIIDHYNF